MTQEELYSNVDTSSLLSTGITFFEDEQHLTYYYKSKLFETALKAIEDNSHSNIRVAIYDYTYLPKSHFEEIVRQRVLNKTFKSSHSRNCAYLEFLNLKKKTIPKRYDIGSLTVEQAQKIINQNIVLFANLDNTYDEDMIIMELT